MFENGIQPFFDFPLSAPLPQVTSRYTSREKESSPKISGGKP
jgi:hypothetical protein